MRDIQMLGNQRTVHRMKVSIRSIIFTGLYLLSDICLADSEEVVVSYLSGDSNVCAVLKTNLDQAFDFSISPNKSINSSGKYQSKKHFKLPNGKALTPTIIDFDNDGDLDAVFKWDDGSRYLTGSIVYVLPNFSELRSEDVKVDEINVYPCQFDKSNPKSSDCPTFSQNADEAGIELTLGERVVFRGRYTDIDIYRYNNKTYLQLRQLHSVDRRYAAVIAPNGEGSFDPVCLFSVSEQ